MAGLGLVADYSSSDDEPNEEYVKELTSKVMVSKPINFFESTAAEKVCDPLRKKRHKDTTIQKKKKKETPPKILPTPFSDINTPSVFDNPFQKEQEVKASILEKHVRMTDNPKDVVEINGKKICWNYRKGRCKFGHRCKYAHDSDINLPNTEEPQPNKISKLSNKETTQYYNSSAEPSTEEEPDNSKRKRRPGLSKGLITSKKVKQLYDAQQAKEQPWLMKR